MKLFQRQFPEDASGITLNEKRLWSTWSLLRIITDTRENLETDENMARKLTAKKYYSIADVSNVTGLKPHVLRFWESEFSQLSPRKNRGGNRMYRVEEIRTIQLIKQLLYSEKYTIAGAKEKLAELNDEKKSPVQADAVTETRRMILDEVRRDLKEIIALLG